MNKQQTNIRRLEDVIDVTHYIVSKAVKRTYQCKILMSEKGVIRMNSTLLKQTEERKFALVFSMDFKELLLVPNCDQAIQFNKNGEIRDVEILDLMRKKKMPFPLEYIVKWDESRMIYEGKLDLTLKK